MEKIGLVRTRDGKSFLVPFILITSLFFLWGVAHSILDVLNKHFQDTLEITRTRSALIQAVVYGGYFIMALPAGRIIRRFGYRTGVLTGLVLYGIGALLFIPGGRIQSFEFFLLALFVIGCGLTCLETASNPYVTVWISNGIRISVLSFSVWNVVFLRRSLNKRFTSISV